jgi:hypothetical protein
MIFLPNFFHGGKPGRIGLLSPVIRVRLPICQLSFSKDLFGSKVLSHGLSIPHLFPIHLAEVFVEYRTLSHAKPMRVDSVSACIMILSVV